VLHGCRTVRLGIMFARVGKFLPPGGKKTFFPWKKPPRQK